MTRNLWPVVLVLLTAVLALRRRPLPRFLGRLLAPWLRPLRKRFKKITWRAFWMRYRPVDIQPSERRPLHMLELSLRRGGTLRFEGGNFYLLAGDRVTCGMTLDELALLAGLEIGKRPKQPHAMIKLSRGLLAGYEGVHNEAEGLSAFIRESMLREIARRREEDRLALCGGFLDGDPADLADLDETEVQRAHAA